MVYFLPWLYSKISPVFFFRILNEDFFKNFYRYLFYHFFRDFCVEPSTNFFRNSTDFFQKIFRIFFWNFSSNYLRNFSNDFSKNPLGIWEFIQKVLFGNFLWGFFSNSLEVTSGNPQGISPEALKIISLKNLAFLAILHHFKNPTMKFFRNSPRHSLPEITPGYILGKKNSNSFGNSSEVHAEISSKNSSEIQELVRGFYQKILIEVIWIFF